MSYCAVVAKYATTLLATAALFATVTSCATRYVPVHHYHETERVKVERDSVHYTDTVRIAERGDTVLVRSSSGAHATRPRRTHSSR